MPKGVHEPADVRFARFVVVNPNGCYGWMGSRKRGYGQFRAVAGGSPVCASRFAWESVHGPIPDGLFVCHHCDNPPCTRLDHLFLGTAQENVDDAVAKGRMGATAETTARGVNASRSKLTTAQVLLVRQWVSTGVSHNEAARRVGIHKSNITRLVNGKAYSDVS